MDSRSRINVKSIDPRYRPECVVPYKEIMPAVAAGVSPAKWRSTAAGTAASSSTRKYRLLAAANFEFVAVWVFEKEGVVTRAVAFADFRPLKFFPASVAHEFRNPIHFLARFRPKRDACAIRFVVFIWTKAKEFRRFVAAAGKESMEVSPGFFVNESKLWQKFSVKLFRHFHVSHSQIDVIEATRFHFVIFDRMARHFKHV
jgi:hypothetical protein